jgi:hypothetical protein
MKKTVISLFVAMVMVSTVAFAQTSTTKTASTGKRPCYVDANNNKVCDRYESHTCKGGNGTGAPNCKPKPQAQNQPQSQDQSKTKSQQTTKTTTAKKTTTKK